MAFIPNIHAFCCHYTSQQTLAEGPAGLAADGFPEGITIHRLVCTGKLEVSTLLKAFEDGADAVYVAGCPADKCHNLMGSQRAAKRVGAVKQALAELGVEPERVEMYHLERGFHPEFIKAGQEMHERVAAMGPSPFKGGAQ
ncbi:MAG: hydrogenase iron-sulfur subunit [Thermodesulfobacteriota bacterium]